MPTLIPALAIVLVTDWTPQRPKSGLALFSTGSAWSNAEPVESGPANTTNCIFDRNNATGGDGGAIYSAAGYDIVEDCWFEANIAGAHMKSLDRFLVRLIVVWKHSVLTERIALVEIHHLTQRVHARLSRKREAQLHCNNAKQEPRTRPRACQQR